MDNLARRIVAAVALVVAAMAGALLWRLIGDLRAKAEADALVLFTKRAGWTPPD